MTSHQQFNDLLEQYVFKVAEQFIESASPESQTRLVNLFLTINKPKPASNLTSQGLKKKKYKLKS